MRWQCSQSFDAGYCISFSWGISCPGILWVYHPHSRMDPCNFQLGWTKYPWSHFWNLYQSHWVSKTHLDQLTWPFHLFKTDCTAQWSPVLQSQNMPYVISTQILSNLQGWITQSISYTPYQCTQYHLPLHCSGIVYTISTLFFDCTPQMGLGSSKLGVIPKIPGEHGIGISMGIDLIEWVSMREVAYCISDTFL